MNSNYKVINMDDYYRKGVFRHFSEDCKCSTSMTARIDVTQLVEYSKKQGTKFYMNFLYILSKVLNSRNDYKMFYENALNDIQKAKSTREYGLDVQSHPNWFDASFIHNIAGFKCHANLKIPD